MSNDANETTKCPKKRKPRKCVGERIFKSLGKVVKHKHPKRTRQVLAAQIDEVIAKVINLRGKKKMSKRFNDNYLIDYLFPSADGKNDRQRLQLNIQCIIDFLVWCKDRIVEDEYTPYEMLTDFVYDMAWLNCLGKVFYPYRIQRSFYWLPIDSFDQAKQWFCCGIAPDRLTSEYMCIFELRQTMEVRFKELLGIDKIVGRVHISHKTIPEILKNLNADNFSPKTGETLTQIMHVYDWTNISIHNMSTDYVWLVWKAIMVCDSFFRPAERKNGMISIYDSFEFSDALLHSLRNRFVDKVCAKNKDVAEFTIEWGTPKAAIVDSNGKRVEVQPQPEHIINRYCKRNDNRH